MGVVSELRSLLDQLAALDLSTLDPAELTDPELLDGIPLLQTTLNQLGALQTRMATICDRRNAQRADGTEIHIRANSGMRAPP